MTGKTHIMKDRQYTYCSHVGRGPHATVYAVRGGEVSEPMLNRPITCQRCARGFRRRLGGATIDRTTAPVIIATGLLLLAAIAHGQGAATTADDYPAPKPAAVCTINVNTATSSKLKMFARTGDVLAAHIIEAREAAPGKTLGAAGLDAVKGIGDVWLAANGPHVRYAGATTCAAKIKGPSKTAAKNGGVR